MAKRLTLILALVFVAGLAFSAYAEVQNVKVGGDITAYTVTRHFNFNESANNDSNSARTEAFASIARLRLDADLTDNVGTTIRLLNERYWGTETDIAGTNSNNTEVSLDLAYITLKEFLYSPLTLTVGRQELLFGDGMIVGDPDTNNVAAAASAFGGRDADLSARKAFDAVRATFDYDALIVDALYSQIQENNLARQDDRILVGLNANYTLSKNTNLEGYYFGKYTGREQNSLPNKPDRVDTVGARLVTKPLENLTYVAEGAFQFGRRLTAGANSTPKRRAFAAETGVNYLFKNAKWTPSATLGYAYFSGQKVDDRKKIRAWDPMFENQRYGDIANALFNQTNAHIAMVTGSLKPADDITLAGEYYAFWWDKKYGENQIISTVRGENIAMKNNKFAGQEVDLKAVYDYTEDVQFSLLTGVLFPGSAFSGANNDPAGEVVGSMKVTF